MEMTIPSNKDHKTHTHTSTTDDNSLTHNIIIIINSDSTPDRPKTHQEDQQIHQYFTGLNQISSAGAFLLGASMIPFRRVRLEVSTRPAGQY